MGLAMWLPIEGAKFYLVQSKRGFIFFMKQTRAEPKRLKLHFVPIINTYTYIYSKSAVHWV
jgi:hypothetical protein